MRRRLEIARALMGRPSVLFLDEPTLGLDPIVRQELWQMIAELREREQVTVLLSTHYLEEAERAYRITQPQIFGTLIPAIGATPYALCGAIYPLLTLPAGVKQFALVLPWTHCVAVLRYGLMGSSASGLHAIWHLHSQLEMALLSIAVLAAFAALTVGLALRAFNRATLS